MQLRAHKTKITATVGPASASAAVMDVLIRAGMDVARLNLSHGGLDDHRRNTKTAVENERLGSLVVGVVGSAWALTLVSSAVGNEM